jgi:hypothetical protein
MSAGRTKLLTVIGGEENETDKLITEEAKSRTDRRFGYSVGEGFCMFLNDWRPKIGMGHRWSVGVSMATEF